MFERRKTRQVVVGRPPGPERRRGWRRPGLGPVDDHDEDRGRRRHARPDLRARRRPAATSCAAPATRRRRPRGSRRSSRARRCRSSPTSTSSTGSRSRRWKPGVQGLRLNPGNIRKGEHIKLVAREAKDRGLPIRIGVNGGQPRPGHLRAVRRRDARGARRVGAARARVLRRGRLRGLQDLGEGEQRPDDDRRVPAALRDGRLPAAPRRHRGRAAAGRAREVHRRDRHAAERGHRRHDPLLAHRGPGRGGARRAHAARVARAARAQGPGPHRVPELRAGRGRRDQGRERRDGRARRTATSRCRSR